ncbi:hypothetical protein IJD34_08215 [bacterium]|nr:hypothetical protein [bacterium]
MLKINPILYNNYNTKRNNGISFQAKKPISKVNELSMQTKIFLVSSLNLIFHSIEYFKERVPLQNNETKDLAEDTIIVDAIGDYLGGLDQKDLDDKKNTNLQYLQILHEAAEGLSYKAQILDQYRQIFNLELKNQAKDEFIYKGNIVNDILKKIFDLQLSLNHGNISERDAFKEYNEILKLYGLLV